MEILRYLGLASEPTWGADDPPTPAEWHVDASSSSLTSPGETSIVHEGGLGRAARTKRPGPYAPSGNIVVPVEMWSLPAYLRWALGSYEFTSEGGDGALHMHEAWGANDVLLPPFAAHVGKDHFEHVFVGCVANQLQLEVSDGMMIATLDVGAKVDSKASLTAAGDLELKDAAYLAFHEVDVKLGGESISDIVRSVELTVDNNLRGDSGRSVGSRYRRRIPAGERQVTVGFSLFDPSATILLEGLWGGSDGPTDEGPDFAEVVLDMVPVDGSGSAKITLPRVLPESLPLEWSGRDEINPTWSGRAFVDTVTLADTTEVETDVLTSCDSEHGDLVPAP